MENSFTHILVHNKIPLSLKFQNSSRGWQCKGEKNLDPKWELARMPIGKSGLWTSSIGVGMTHDQKDYCDSPSPDSDFPTLDLTFRSWIET